jgi:hypothetical protein
LREIFTKVKRALSILFIAIATFNLALFTVMPHHHHGAAMCAAAAHCAQDNTPEQAGSHTDNGLRHCAACVARTDALGTAAHHEHKCKFTCDHPSHHHQPLPALLTVTGFASEPAAFSFTAVTCGVAGVFLPSAGINRHAGLRAPPFLS